MNEFWEMLREKTNLPEDLPENILAHSASKLVEVLADQLQSQVLQELVLATQAFIANWGMCKKMAKTDERVFNSDVVFAAEKVVVAQFEYFISFIESLNIPFPQCESIMLVDEIKDDE